MWLLLSVVAICYSYEQPTHVFLTESAFNASVLANDSSLLVDLGLDDSSAQFPDPVTGNILSIKQLLMNGANFEDGRNLQESIVRTSNHFYDPIYDRPLTPCPLGLIVNCNKSPDWALENSHDISSDPSVQIYSYKDANEYYYKAQTESKKSDRDIYWGKTFQTLGHIIHHVQDMAQPEHVRNDQHITGIDTSYYEAYTDKRRNFAESGQDPEFLDLVQSGIYPIPDFPTAREFWTTRDSNPPGTRKGIADFTNANFVSKDTNFKIDNGLPAIGSEYDAPVPGPVTTKPLASVLSNGDEVCQKLKDNGPYDMPPDATCDIDFIASNVIDNLNPTKNRINEYASSISIFDAYLEAYNINSVSVNIDDTQLVDIDKIPTLNRINYNETQKDVIPRAVSYSAGLINHFFKGRIDFFKNTSNNKWTISNLSTIDLDGTFTLYRESYDNERTRTLVTQWSLSLQPGSQYEIQEFVDAYPSEPKILVFKGREGSQGTNSGEYYSTAAKVIYPSNQIDVYVSNSNTIINSESYACGGYPSIFDGLVRTNYIAVSNGVEIRRWTYEQKGSINFAYYDSCNYMAGSDIQSSSVIDGVWLGLETQFDINDPLANGYWRKAPAQNYYSYNFWPQIVLQSGLYQVVTYTTISVGNWCPNSGLSATEPRRVFSVPPNASVDTYTETFGCNTGAGYGYNTWTKNVINLR